ncbi:unnamed protein product [Kuraishia capsulata CBS 1993]|uniref:GPI ethanolamine phosphate transferase 2 n=1 Tax=Kuraishia capsulata CBS 1993 TaxID=1382522 RepID=W6MVC7_9ASCO|nr:uncharacterized protein KUCA_T00002186001 [Kuraishia capsulata CBS 1993]CDK26215.1 unnamed protein product [Kuraishia capsulata CBS 1993]
MFARVLLLFTLAVAQLVGLLLFAKGFFPGKVVLKGNGEFYHDSAPFEQQYDRLVLMVVDAMRSDFMFSTESRMSFVHELINKGEALGFTAYSNPPTVTLPRLKGITTGATPNFLDAILNIAEEDTSSTLGDQDSWVKELFMKGFKINMFGDDTWLKLFPSYFSKTDGTSSFYVADFTEVDLNVTRNLQYEIDHKNEWDAMILHYLGLDHIGHKGGPTSPHMAKKQGEMDDIVKKLYNEIVKKDPRTLLIVMGDHGMNDIGNHGGSSAGETSAAMLFVSQKLGKVRQIQDLAPLSVDEDFSYFKRIQQIDLVPTLAALFDFPIPKNNLGVFIEDFLPLFKKDRSLNVLLQNAYQMRVLLERGGIDLEKGDSALSKAWLEASTTKTSSSIYEFLKEAQDELAGASSNYNYNDIYLGLALFAMAAVVHLVQYVVLFSANKITGFVYLIGFVLYAASFFGSSLIEEEHQVWWWLAISSCAILFGLQIRSGTKGSVFTSLLVLFLARLLRGWNNSGQKFNLTTNVKIGSIIDGEKSLGLGMTLFTCYLFSSAVTKMSRAQEVVELVSFLSSFLLGSIAASIKILTNYEDLEETPKFLRPLVIWIMDNLDTVSPRACLVPMFQLFYMTLGCVLAARLMIHRVWPERFAGSFFSDLLHTVTILLIVQASQRNVPLFVILLLLRWAVGTSISRATSGLSAISNITVFSIILQHLSFFSSGSTNSLSTVDLTNSFNGVSDYGLISVGVLTYISNFGGPLFVILSSLVLLYEYRHKDVSDKFDVFYRKSVIQFTFYSIAGIFLMVACYSLRFHLFIWTVFSPKVLYFLSWFATNVVVDFVLGLVLVALW